MITIKLRYVPKLFTKFYYIGAQDRIYGVTQSELNQ